MLDIPLPTNFGGIALAALIIIAIAAAAQPHPCPWRCSHCDARFPTRTMVEQHEARHRHPAYLPALDDTPEWDPTGDDTPDTLDIAPGSAEWLTEWDRAVDDLADRFDRRQGA